MSSEGSELSQELKCGICNRIYLRKKFLVKHLHSHKQLLVFTCTDCGKTLPTKTRLKTHSRIHTGERPFRCSNCNNTFPTRHQLKLHNRRHTGEKPCKCSYCEKQFSSASGLRQHVKTHIHESPFCCKECGKTFRQRDKLQQHERIHTGAKPYMCDRCPMSFRNKNSLVRHLRIHSGEMYKCSLCPKQFGELYALKKHHRIKHDKVVFSGAAENNTVDGNRTEESSISKLKTGAANKKVMHYRKAGNAKQRKNKSSTAKRDSPTSKQKSKENSSELNKDVIEKLYLAIGQRDDSAVLDENGWHRIPLPAASDLLSRNMENDAVNGAGSKSKRTSSECSSALGATVTESMEQRCPAPQQNYSKVQAELCHQNNTSSHTECHAEDNDTTDHTHKRIKSVSLPLSHRHQTNHEESPNIEQVSRREDRRENTHPSTIEYFPDSGKAERNLHEEDRNDNQNMAVLPYKPAMPMYAQQHHQNNLQSCRGLHVSHNMRDTQEDPCHDRTFYPQSHYYHHHHHDMHMHQQHQHQQEQPLQHQPPQHHLPQQQLPAQLNLQQSHNFIPHDTSGYPSVSENVSVFTENQNDYVPHHPHHPHHHQHHHHQHEMYLPNHHPYEDQYFSSSKHNFQQYEGRVNLGGSVSHDLPHHAGQSSMRQNASEIVHHSPHLPQHHSHDHHSAFSKGFAISQTSCKYDNVHSLHDQERILLSQDLSLSSGKQDVPILHQHELHYQMNHPAGHLPNIQNEQPLLLKDIFHPPPNMDSAPNRRKGVVHHKPDPPLNAISQTITGADTYESTWDSNFQSHPSHSAIAQNLMYHSFTERTNESVAAQASYGNDNPFGSSSFGGEGLNTSHGHSGRFSQRAQTLSESVNFGIRAVGKETVILEDDMNSCSQIPPLHHDMTNKNYDIGTVDEEPLDLHGNVKSCSLIPHLPDSVSGKNYNITTVCEEPLDLHDNVNQKPHDDHSQQISFKTFEQCEYGVKRYQNQTQVSDSSTNFLRYLPNICEKTKLDKHSDLNAKDNCIVEEDLLSVKDVTNHPRDQAISVHSLKLCDSDSTQASLKTIQQSSKFTDEEARTAATSHDTRRPTLELHDTEVSHDIHTSHETTSSHCFTNPSKSSNNQIHIFDDLKNKSCPAEDLNSLGNVVNKSKHLGLISGSDEENEQETDNNEPVAVNEHHILSDSDEAFQKSSQAELLSVDIDTGTSGTDGRGKLEESTRNVCSTETKVDDESGTIRPRRTECASKYRKTETIDSFVCRTDEAKKSDFYKTNNEEMLERSGEYKSGRRKGDDKESDVGENFKSESEKTSNDRELRTKGKKKHEPFQETVHQGVKDEVIVTDNNDKAVNAEPSKGHKGKRFKTRKYSCKSVKISSNGSIKNSLSTGDNTSLKTKRPSLTERKAEFVAQNCIINEKKSIFECKACGKKCNSARQVRNHIVTSHYNDTLHHMCPECGKQFSHKSWLTRHVKTHKQKPYPCSKCPQAFTAKKYLENHLKRHEKSPPSFVCSECGKTFGRRYQLKVHFRTHSGEKPYNCSFCSLCFATSFQVHLHERVHTKVRPYQCRYCGKCFMSNANLCLHLKRHGNDRRYLCAVCGAKFYEANKLQEHSRVHTGVQPYMCDQCPKTFKVKHLLVRHMRWHTGDTFKCKLCPKAFDEKWILKAHIKRRHPGS